MYHWIRDCSVVHRGGTDNMGYGESNYVFYHFLRTAGWDWIWECDGDEDNHCADGSMEASGTTSWTAVGSASLSKDTGSKHMLTQSLQIDSSALNDGVQSAAMVNTTVSTNYRMTLWASNTTGQTWDVRVDPGTGSFGSVGTITATAAWTRYDFSFTTNSSGTPYFQIIDDKASTGTVYVDSVIIFKSFFEYNGVDAEDLSGSPDGQILNSNEFHSGSYSFVGGDVGKHVCVWDTTNLGNSGVYQITALNGSDAVLDLRAGGTPALVSQTGLRWRMIDVSVAARISNFVPSEEKLSGWGLQSPNSENWRLFIRNNQTGSSRQSGLVTYSSPYDADFDVETGLFSRGEISTIIEAGSYTKGTMNRTGSLFFSRGQYASGTYNRLYLQTDDDCSFVIIIARPGDGTYQNYQAFNAFGFSGADSYHTLRESFVHFGGRVIGDVGYQLYWNDSSPTERANQYGCQVMRESVATGMTSCVWMCLGYGSSTSNNKDGYSSARLNPFSSERILFRPKIARDYYGIDSSCPSEKEITTMGLWDGIADTTDWASVESHTLLHLGQGVFFELPSSGGTGLFETLS